jgi:hypothetical protein
MSAKAPAEVVNEQVGAYNARNLAAFVATYAEDICIYQMPHAKLLARGRAALSEHYGSKIFAKEGLRAEVLSRQTIGNKVIDHELTYGLRPNPEECVVVYEVHEGLISGVWFFRIDGLSEPPQ